MENFRKTVNNLNRTRVAVGKVWGTKKTSPKGRKGGWRKNACAALLQGQGIERRTSRALGKPQEMHTTVIASTSNPFCVYKQARVIAQSPPATWSWKISQTICDPTPANEALCGKINFELWAKNVKSSQNFLKIKLCLRTNFDINFISS